MTDLFFKHVDFVKKRILFVGKNGFKYDINYMK